MISAVVLTKNNADIMKKTLLSLSFCDEIIVIDDYSSDETVSLSKKHGAVVCKRHLSDDFSKQRNFGLSKAKGDWVLFVDSDELVTKNLQEEIEKRVKEESGVNGYYIKRTDFFLGKELQHGETAGVRLLRLAKKGTGIWTRPVHEVWNVEGKTETLQFPLLHFPHPNVAQFLNDINYYSSLNARHFHKEGVRTSCIEIIVYPSAKFFVNYIAKLGFLDGTAGIVMALMMSFHSFLTRGKLWELQQRKSHI